MAPLRAIPDPEDWASEIAEDAQSEYRGRIEIVKITAGGYDEESDTPSPPSVQTVISARRARIQPLGFPLESNGGLKWEGKQRFRFQMDLFPDDPEVEQGMTVRILDGGRDPRLVDITATVLVATNSSSAAQRTIEAYSA